MDEIIAEQASASHEKVSHTVAVSDPYYARTTTMMLTCSATTLTRHRPVFDGVAPQYQAVRLTPELFIQSGPHRFKPKTSTAHPLAARPSFRIA